jgi:hypothetical protein
VFGRFIIVAQCPVEHCERNVWQRQRLMTKSEISEHGSLKREDWERVGRDEASHRLGWNSCFLLHLKVDCGRGILNRGIRAKRGTVHDWTLKLNFPMVQFCFTFLNFRNCKESLRSGSQLKASCSGSMFCWREGNIKARRDCEGGEGVPYVEPNSEF